MSSIFHRINRILCQMTPGTRKHRKFDLFHFKKRQGASKIEVDQKSWIPEVIFSIANFFFRFSGFWWQIRIERKLVEENADGYPCEIAIKGTWHRSYVWINCLYTNSIFYWIVCRISIFEVWFTWRSVYKSLSKRHKLQRCSTIMVMALRRWERDISRWGKLST